MPRTSSSSTQCLCCGNQFSRLLSHLNHSSKCNIYYETKDNNSSIQESPRRSKRNKSTIFLQGSLKKKSHIDTFPSTSNHGNQHNISSETNNDDNTLGLINPDPIATSTDENEFHYPLDDEHHPIHPSIDNQNEFQTNDNNPFDFTSISKSMEKMQNTSIFTIQQLVSLKLYDILRRSNAPINLYDEIRCLIDWSVPKFKQYYPPYLSTRSSLIKDMESNILNGSTPIRKKRKSSSAKRSSNRNDKLNVPKIQHYNFTLRPVQKIVRLKDTTIDIHVPTFDIVSQITSMLNNRFLMKKAHTIYHRTQFTDPVSTNSDIIDDIESTQWFANAHKSIIKDKNSEIVCPLIFFIDGISIDSYGRTSLEPVIFTMGIFKRQIRNLTSAWRVLGFIPNPHKATPINYKRYKNGDDLKKYHYHQILEAILEDLQKLQERGGIKWLLPFPDGSMREVTLKFVIAYIIGDCLGHDKSCCRKQNYSPTKLQNTGACRDCNVIYKYCSDYNFSCDPLSRNVIRNSSKAVLNYLSFYDIGINAFDKISFGGSLMGINGSTPPEPLHQWYLGVVQFLIEYFLAHLTSKSLQFLNECVSNMSIDLNRQSDRDMPTISMFNNGIDKVKLTGRERGSQLFMIYITMIVTPHKNKFVELEQKSAQRYKIVTTTNPDNTKTKKRIIFNRLMDSNVKYNKWLSLFQDMVSLSEWLSSSSSMISKDTVMNKNIGVNLWSLDNYDEWVSLISANKNYDAAIDEIDEYSNSIIEDNIHFNDFLHDPNTDVCNIEETDENDIEIQYEGTEENIEDFNLNSDQIFEGLKVMKKVQFISIAEYGLRVFMKNFKNVISRDDWHRLLSVKFHQLIHIIMYIIEFGPPCNYDGGIPERVIKELAKHPGSHTQLRQASVNKQASHRVAEDMIISQGISLAYETNQYSSSNGWSKYFTNDFVKDTYDEIDDDVSSYSNHLPDSIAIKSKGCSTFEYSLQNIHVRNKSSLLKFENISIVHDAEDSWTKKTPWSSHEERFKIVIQTLYNSLNIEKEMNENFKITLFNTFSLNGTKYNAAFDYCGGEFSWFDWCSVQYTTGVFPGKIIAIIDGNKLLTEFGMNRDNNTNIPSGDVWIVVQSTKVVNSSNFFTSEIATLYNMDSQFYLLSVENILSPCFAIPNKLHNEVSNSKFSFLDISERDNTIILHNRNRWSSCFMDKPMGLI